MAFELKPMTAPTERRSESGWQHLLPPVPNEHGAWVMLTAAVLTPIAVVAARGVPTEGRPAQFGLFVALAVLALLFRETLRRLELHEEPARRRRLRRIATVEAGAIGLLALGLGILAGPWWLLGAVAIPAVVADVRVRRRGWPVPLGGELSGVAALSVAVPAGALSLGLDGIETAALLWLLYLAFHVGSVLRVQSRLSGTKNRKSTVERVNLAYHGTALIFAGAGWYVGSLGSSAPLLFALATVQTATDHGGGPVELKRIGRTEGVLSSLFVLGAPWLLPF